MLLVGIALSPLFYINSIEVYGNKHYNNIEVINASRIVLGANWFRELAYNADIKGMLTFRSTNSRKYIRKMLLCKRYCCADGLPREGEDNNY